ncbi:MAG: hypothetical protein JNL70_07490 [Saprospiraceae bacterium]|nr:hypothetical protein [Saprospiraceae bacterium]
MQLLNWFFFPAGTTHSLVSLFKGATYYSYSSPLSKSSKKNGFRQTAKP